MSPSTDTYHSGFTRLPTTDIEKYADHEHVSSDGCRHRDDISHRKTMIRTLVDGHRHGRILPPKSWVL